MPSLSLPPPNQIASALALLLLAASPTPSASTQHNQSCASRARRPPPLAACTRRSRIDECAQGSDERRRAAVDQAGVHDGKEEVPLHAAWRLDRGELAGVLLEAGADAGAAFEGASALSVAIMIGLAGTVRFLLKAGQDPNERLYVKPGFFTTAVHMCITPPRKRSPASAAVADVPLYPPPRLDCLEILVREGGADVDVRDSHGETALCKIVFVVGDRIAAIDRLVDLGADVNARNDHGSTPIFGFDRSADLVFLRRLIKHGASVDVSDNTGWTPLMWACSGDSSSGRDVAFELARSSSPETLRAVTTAGKSAADMLVDTRSAAQLNAEPWCLQLLGELLANGASMRHVNATHVLRALAVGPEARNLLASQPWRVGLVGELLAAGAVLYSLDVAPLLPIAAALSHRQSAELAARRSEARRWRARDTFVWLALDKQEEREAEERVAAKRRRVAELEFELAGQGAAGGEADGEVESGEGSGSSESGESSESSDSGESNDDDGGRAASAGAGTSVG